MRVATYLAAVAFIALVWPAGAQDTEQAALIQGVASRTTNGEPVSGVTVNAVSDSGKKYSTITDDSGTFSLKAIPAGHYSLSASRSGYLPYDSEKHSTGVSVAGAQQLKDLRIRLTPTGAISGKVVDNNRRPVVGATVMAIRPTFVNGRQVLVPDQAYTGFLFPVGAKLVPAWEYPKAVTDDRGQYRIFDLPPGEYYVSVWNAGAETLEDVTDLVNSIDKTQGSTKDQPPIYYPGVVNPGDAVPLSVNGTEREGIDLELRSQVLHRFRFEVVPPAIPPEQPCPGFGVSAEAIVLIRHTQNLDVIQYSSRFGNTAFKKSANNQWTSPPLPEGSYEVFFSPCMFSRLARVGTLTAVIADRDVDAGKLLIPLNPSVTGSVQKSEAPSVALDKVQVRLRPLDLRTASVTMSPRRDYPRTAPAQGPASVKKDGTFSFDLTGGDGSFPSASPGLYQLDVAGLPDGVYVASIKLRGIEVRDTGFRVDAGVDVSLEVSLSQQDGVVNGVVTDRLGKLVVDSVVALMPWNRELVYSNLFKETRTAQDGTFTIRGLPPGEYGMIATDDLDTGVTRSAEFREVYQTRLLKIVIKPGSRETLSLTATSR